MTEKVDNLVCPLQSQKFFITQYQGPTLTKLGPLELATRPGLKRKKDDQEKKKVERFSKPLP